MACSLALVKGRLVVLVGALVLVPVVVRFLYSGGEPSAPSADGSFGSVDLSASDGSLAKVPAEPVSEPRAVAPHPAVDAETREVLNDLRASFGPEGSKPNRFRLMRRLDVMWGDSPPVGLLLRESADPSAPEGYRSHFAGRLRNLGKSAQPAARAELAAAMGEFLAAAPPGIDMSVVAQGLIAFDDSPPSIRAVDGRIDAASGDEEVAALLAALVQSRSAESRAAVWQHTRDLAVAPDRHPLALSTSLPPLAREPDIPIEPVLQGILGSTSRFDLFETALAGVFVRAPTPGGLAAAQVAIRRSGDFGDQRQAEIRALVRSGLNEWSRRFPEADPAVTQPIATLLEQIP